MPNTSRISCSLGKTINTGNYNSLRVDWTEEITFPPEVILSDDALEHQRAQLYERVENALIVAAENAKRNLV